MGEADEKARLEALVCAFTSRALKGCPCTCLQDATGKRAATRYRIDKELRNFTFEASGRILKKGVKVPLNGIENIYSIEKDGVSVFPTNIIQVIQPSEYELLLMVIFRTDGDKLVKLCFLEESAACRETSHVCLNILKDYVQ